MEAEGWQALENEGQSNEGIQPGDVIHLTFYCNTFPVMNTNQPSTKEGMFKPLESHSQALLGR